MAATGDKLERVLPPRPALPWSDPEWQARMIAAEAERNAAPLVTRDAMLALLDETRAIEKASAKRERWILIAAVGTFLVSVGSLGAAVALILLEVL